jgi:hypothetical protein
LSNSKTFKKPTKPVDNFWISVDNFIKYLKNQEKRFEGF